MMYQECWLNLGEIIQRIVEVAKPDQIVMFGSAARGEMGPYSDIDPLVIKKGVKNPRDVAARIYRRLYGVGIAVDIIVVSQKKLRNIAIPHIWLFILQCRKVLLFMTRKQLSPDNPVEWLNRAKSSLALAKQCINPNNVCSSNKVPWTG